MSDERPQSDPDSHFDADVAPTFVCPSCDHAFAVAAVPPDGLLECPACGGQFLGAADASDEDRAAAEKLQLEHEARSQRIGDLHRNKVLLERRALARTRTYVVLLIGLLFTIGLKLTITAGGMVYYGVADVPRAATYAAIAAACGVIVALLARRAIAMTRELAKPALPEPTAPPDFSSLSDGSQILDDEIKNLERLSGR